MKPYLVDTPDGKTITIEGPDDATDDELIAIAQKNYSANAKPVGKTKAPVDTRGTDLSLPADRTSRDLPDAGTAESLISEMKAGDASLQNAAPAAFKRIEKAGSAPPARGSINDKIAEGDLEGAWNSLTDLEKGSLVASVPVLAYGGYKIADKFLGGKKEEKPIQPKVEPTFGSAEPPPNNIKSRTFEAGNYGNQTIETTPKGMSAKETQIATDIKNRYGYDFNDLKNRFGLGDVPINDVTQAEMLANTVRNQEAAAAETPKTPASQAPATPVQEAKPAAPIAETPKAPAPPPEAAPKAAVPPKKAPKEKIAMPEGWGKGMSWLTTVHGAGGAQAFIDQYNNGKPFASHKEMEEVYKNVTMRPKYSDIPKSVRQERGITPRASLPNLPLTAVPPPSLRPAPQLGGGGGSMMRGIGDPLQLKQ
jgi:hypothetical protein